MAQVTKNASLVIVALMVATALAPLLLPNVGASTGSRAYVAENEPNQSYAQATELQPGDHAGGLLNWTDRNDVFKVNVTAGKICNISLYLIDYTPGTPYDYNLDYEVIAPAQFIIYDHYWQEKRLDAQSFLVYETGYHFIWVYANGTASTHTKDTRYTLSVNQFDPISTGPGTQTGNLDSSLSYMDAWYRLTLPAGQGVRAHLTAPAGADFDLILFCKYPYQPAYKNGISSPYIMNQSFLNETPTDETVEGLSMDGTYYIKVLGWSGTGAYSLTITEASFFDDGDSTMATATFISENKTDRITMSDLTQSFDFVDWYKITLGPGEYANANLDIMSSQAQVCALFGFTDQWGTTQLWEYTTTNGGAYQQTSNPLDTSASIKFAPNAAGVPSDTDFFFYVRADFKFQNGDDVFDPAEFMYRITWDLPNYGAMNRSKEIPPIKMDEDTSFTLDLNDYFVDPEGDTLGFSYTPSPIPNVTVDIDQITGNAVITPNPNYNNGGDPINITFKATDGTADWGLKSTTLMTTLTIKPLNDPPTVQYPLQNITMNEDATNATNPEELSKVFRDLDEDHLIYRMIGADKIPVNIDPVSTKVSLGPVNDWFGEETITIQAEDPMGAKANSTFKVTVKHVNHDPIGKNGKTRFYHNVTEDTVDDSLNVSTMFFDKDVAYANDSLKFSIEYPLGYTEPFHMDVSLSGNDLVVEPEINWTGTEEVPIFARDLNGSKVVIILAITVQNVNDPPVIQEVTPPLLEVVIDEGKSQKFEVKKYYDSDPGDFITYRWFLDGAVLPVTSSANYYNLETDFTNSTGKLSAGNYTLMAVVTDTMANANFTWHVEVKDMNRFPTGLGITEPTSGKKIKPGQKITLRAQKALDADGDALTYTWKDETTGLTIGTGDSVLYSTKKTGDHKLTVIVSDGKGGTAQTSVTITVKAEEAGGLSMMMIGAIIAIIVVVIIIVVVVVAMRGRRSRPPESQKEVADNYEAQLWGKEEGGGGGGGGAGASRGARPPPAGGGFVRPSRAAPPPAAEPSADEGAPAERPSEEPPEEDAVPTWSPAGAKVQETTEAPEEEPVVPKATATAAAKPKPGPPPPGPPQ